MGLGASVAMVTSLSLFAPRTHDHLGVGALSGMAQFIGDAGAAVGPFLAGILHHAAGRWTASVILLTAPSALATVFTTLAGRSRFVE